MTNMPMEGSQKEFPYLEMCDKNEAEIRRRRKKIRYSISFSTPSSKKKTDRKFEVIPDTHLELFVNTSISPTNFEVN